MKHPHIITMEHLKELKFNKPLCISERHAVSINYYDCRNLTGCDDCIFDSSTIGVTKEYLKSYLIERKIITKGQLLELVLDGILI